MHALVVSFRSGSTTPTTVDAVLTHLNMHEYIPFHSLPSFHTNIQNIHPYLPVEAIAKIMEVPKRMGDAISMGYWVPSGAGGVTDVSSSCSCSSGWDQSRVGDCWSASLSDTPVTVFGAKKQARRAVVAAGADGAVPKACTCTAKQKRKSDIIRIIIVVVVVNQKGGVE
jgi:hypothetical protein